MSTTATRPVAAGGSIVLDHSAEVVWAAVSDYSVDTAWRKAIVEMSAKPDGPPAVGVEVHEVMRSSGSTYVTDSVVTEVGPDMSYKFEGNGTAGRVLGGRRVTPLTDAQSEFHYDIELYLSGWLRFVRPVAGIIMRRAMAGDMRRLAGLLDEKQ